MPTAGRRPARRGDVDDAITVLTERLDRLEARVNALFAGLAVIVALATFGAPFLARALG